ncbi:MAG: hypothetical protein QG616_1347 [Pseudomonadota bacterium]|nr:hypothetical protein [Pseudomonadota bacterium]
MMSGLKNVSERSMKFPKKNIPEPPKTDTYRGLNFARIRTKGTKGVCFILFSHPRTSSFPPLQITMQSIHFRILMA